MDHRVKSQHNRKRTVMMEFVVVKSPSPYNIIIGRTRMRSLGVVASTIDYIIKFLTSNGIETMVTCRKTLWKCRQIEEAQSQSQHAQIITLTVPHVPKVTFPTVTQVPVNPSSGVAEKVVVNDRYPKQFITTGKDLSSEHRLVDRVTFKYKCSLEAYNGYHHIRMAREDEGNTAFHTEEGVYCYTKMPFGLKSVKVTYQRLVNTDLKRQIGVNLESYLYDMVIKSRMKYDIIKDVEETKSNLRWINMKPNPKRLSFCMEEVLRYIVTSD
nr:reverse transcriptase domain-containing protein [Tanacetum cinerariifolium]